MQVPQHGDRSRSQEGTQEGTGWKADRQGKTSRVIRQNDRECIEDNELGEAEVWIGAGAGEPAGVPTDEAMHDEVGKGTGADEVCGALLCIWSCVQKTDKHLEILDNKARVDPKGKLRRWEMRRRRRVRGRDLGM